MVGVGGAGIGAGSGMGEGVRAALAWDHKQVVAFITETVAPDCLATVCDALQGPGLLTGEILLWFLVHATSRDCLSASLQAIRNIDSIINRMRYRMGVGGPDVPHNCLATLRVSPEKVAHLVKRPTDAGTGAVTTQASQKGTSQNGTAVVAAIVDPAKASAMVEKYQAKTPLQTGGEAFWEIPKEVTSAQHLEFCQAVKLRDTAGCVLCTTTSGTANLHAAYILTNSEHAPAAIPIASVKNGLLLCNKCHGAFRSFQVSLTARVKVSKATGNRSPVYKVYVSKLFADTLPNLDGRHRKPANFPLAVRTSVGFLS